jgi:hypothetical protein
MRLPSVWVVRARRLLLRLRLMPIGSHVGNAVRLDSPDERELVPTAQIGYDKDSGKTDKNGPAFQILASSCHGQSDSAAQGRLDRHESWKTKSY